MHHRPAIPDADAAVALRLLASACHQCDGAGLAMKSLRSFLRSLESRVRLPDIAAMIGAALEHLSAVERDTSIASQRSALHALLDLSGLIAHALESRTGCSIDPRP